MGSYSGSNRVGQELTSRLASNDPHTMSKLDPVHTALNHKDCAKWPDADIHEYAEAASSLARYRAEAPEHLKNDELALGGLISPSGLVSQRLNLLAALQCGAEDYNSAIALASAAAKSTEDPAIAEPNQPDKSRSSGEFARARDLNNLGVLAFVKAEQDGNPAARNKLFSAALSSFVRAQSIQQGLDPDDKQLLQKAISDNRAVLSLQQKIGD